MTAGAMPEAERRADPALERPCPHCGLSGRLKPHCTCTMDNPKCNRHACGWIKCEVCSAIIERATFAHVSDNTKSGHGKKLNHCVVAR